MKQAKIELHYRIPLWPLLAYYGVIAIMMAGFLQRHNAGFWQNMPVLGGAEVGSHLANLAISFLIITGVGLMWIIAGTISWKAVGALVVVLIAANVVYEVFLSIINTRDVVDALYGIAGVAAGAAVLFLLNRSKISANSN